MFKVDEKIAIITTSEQLAESAVKAVKKLGLNIKVEAIEARSLEGAVNTLVEKAKEYQKNGIGIIITRPEGDKILKKAANVNSVGIDLTGYDILRCLIKYRDYNKPIAVLECEEITENVKTVGDILGLDIHPYKTNCKDIHSRIDEAVKDGIELLIVGSGGFHEFEKNYVRNKGLTFEQIEPSEITIIKAIRSACKLYKATLKERERAEMFEAVLNFSKQGIVSVDRDGNISTFNPIAERFFRLNEQAVIGKPIKDIIPDTQLARTLLTGEIETGEIVDIDNYKLVVDRIPIHINGETVGAVGTYQEIKQVQEREQKVRRNLVNTGLAAKYTFNSIIGCSEILRQTVELARTYSETSSTVLITGETGTGKEVFAQAIHSSSNRRNAPFVAVNCSALPGNLLESELFGYEDGAFTGAKKGGKQGIFELAHNGTIFLDEIGEIDKTVQTRLLRVIQEREIMPIGSNRIIPIDVRIIAATNRDLYEEVELGNFRSDLYFRLNVLNLQLPALRERKDDIQELTESLINRLNKRLKCRVTGVDRDVLNFLKEYDWPGNIREFQNMLEKMVVLTRSGVVKYDNVAVILKQLKRRIQTVDQVDIYNFSLEEIERRVIKRVLEDERYNKSRTAKRLGIDRSTLFRKLERYA